MARVCRARRFWFSESHAVSDCLENVYGRVVMGNHPYITRMCLSTLRGASQCKLSRDRCVVLMFVSGGADERSKNSHASLLAIT